MSPATEQLSLNDEQAAWTRYLELCRRCEKDDPQYELIESWAWAELQASLAVIRRRIA